MKKLKVLLIINSIIFGVSGFFAVLFPERVLAIYGVKTEGAVSLMAQYAGLGSIAIALIIWFTRKLDNLTALRGIVFALLITYIIGTAISILGTVSGVMRRGWPVIALYGILAITYTYFYFNHKEVR